MVTNGKTILYMYNSISAMNIHDSTCVSLNLAYESFFSDFIYVKQDDTL